MRLTKLKLAGFKSFVDPTTIALPGQLVGVVGPNGCGKSNVMDAVRWVLGESKASELRGESMQDVIFNGSGNRKPVSRAAVELIFDNSLGRAAGQWSQFAELSVKRVLTRNGQSDYYINNLRVRRKDITDLFLGTGLGPRAYAIIGQGTISRIIEARPDELRVFLEEAAGVTRYKERRKETEGRIADTRENLTRVEDIRQELAGQMERLESQAVVARRYHELNGDLTRKQQLLWLLRRNEAAAERERLAREIERTGNEFEAQTAALRDAEARLEAAREAHYQANDGLHAAQGELFNVNAEVARLEAEIRHQRESRRQLESRLGQLETESRHWQEQAERVESDRLRWEELGELAEARVEQARAKLEARQERLPVVEAAAATAQEEVARERNRIVQAEQRLQVELTHQSHAQRTLQSLAQRRDRLEREQQDLAAPDLGHLEIRREELAMLGERLGEAQEAVALAQHELPALEAGRRQALTALQLAQKELASAQARSAALEQLQRRVEGNAKLGDWLRRHGLDGRTPLWRQIHVEAGWEDAVEAVLRERLSAIDVDAAALAALAADPPAGKQTFMLADGSGALPPAADALAARVRCNRVEIAAAVGDWLAGVRAAESLPAALAAREDLVAGERLVTREGHLVDRHGVTLFAPDSAEHGKLERQREIEELAGAIDLRQAGVEEAQEALAGVEARLAEVQARLQASRREVQELQGRQHGLQVEVLKLGQAEERHREKVRQITDALADLAAEEEVERERQMLADEAIAEARDDVSRLQSFMSEARGRLEQVERQLRDERDAVAAAEREWREAQFSQRECASKLAEIAANRTLASRQLERIGAETEAARESAAAIEVDDLEPRLQTALAERVDREQALAAARDALEQATTALRGLEEQRLRLEQSLNPLRDRVGDLKLKEQAAALNVEQFEAQLAEAGADVAALTPELGSVRPAALQSAIGQLQKAIAELGAVNLAALEELESARERKGYLDAQAEDLTVAMETLENAIRRIDRETRELLQNTYDVVNRQFGELFPTLFGGGEARLIMTGEEILDAGVQVMAQPPGKKNSTIHLLSGGEKALTAIALVFALFQLNPAPFCLLDEVDAPLDDTNTERFCDMVKKMSVQTQFLFISHNKIAMEMAQQLVGVTMQESGVSRIVEVDIEEALRMREQVAA